mmetsp:Transcript_13246/g.48248  ORF Transcript_13246/g.48248 Transcript_13246/m.48248 type:complete len:236 (+) Transcript_13246:2215-2922(+)
MRFFPVVNTSDGVTLVRLSRLLAKTLPPTRSLSGNLARLVHWLNCRSPFTYSSRGSCSSPTHPRRSRSPPTASFCGRALSSLQSRKSSEPRTNRASSLMASRLVEQRFMDSLCVRHFVVDLGDRLLVRIPWLPLLPNHLLEPEGPYPPGDADASPPSSRDVFPPSTCLHSSRELPTGLGGIASTTAARVVRPLGTFLALPAWLSLGPSVCCALLVALPLLLLLSSPWLLLLLLPM